MAVTNVWTRGALLLLLLASDASSSSSSAVAYNLVPRSTAAVLPAARHALERAMVGGNFSDLLSFDGDVEALKALALEKAASQEDGEPAPPSSFSCDDAEAVLHLEIIQWKYSIETVPTAVVQTVYGEVQEITLEHVAPRSLSCLNETAAFAHIVALDTSIPGHQESAGTRVAVVCCLFEWHFSH